MTGEGGTTILYGRVHPGIDEANGGGGDLKHVQEALTGKCREVTQIGQGCWTGKFGSGGAGWRQCCGRVGQVLGIQYCFCICFVFQ